MNYQRKLSSARKAGSKQDYIKFLELKALAEILDRLEHIEEFLEEHFAEDENENQCEGYEDEDEDEDYDEDEDEDEC